MKKELLGSLVVMALCALLIQQALKLPPARFETLGPSFFPLLVLGLMAGLSVLHVVLTLVTHLRAVHAGAAATAPAGEAVAEMGDGASRWQTARHIILTLLAFTLYVALLDETDLPYPPLTVAFIAATTWMLGGFRPRALVYGCLVGAGITTFIYVVFGVYLRTVFP